MYKRQALYDFTIVFDFKSTDTWDNAGDCTNWYSGVGLVDSDASGEMDDFGISMCASKIILGIRSTNLNSGTNTYNDGNWHSVKVVRVSASGYAALLVDGRTMGSITNGVYNSLTAHSKIRIGQIANGFNSFTGTMRNVAIYNEAAAVPAKKDA